LPQRQIHSGTLAKKSLKDGLATDFTIAHPYISPLQAAKAKCARMIRYPIVS
jgi:hypothetical protein